jgi:hypothetical protein
MIARTVQAPSQRFTVILALPVSRLLPKPIGGKQTIRKPA